MAKKNVGYTLFPKTSSDGKTKRFYVQFTDRSGKRMTAKSVEKIRAELGDSEQYNITRKAEAHAICMRAIEAGIADGRRDRKTVCKPFSEYLTLFWDYDNSEYIKRKNTKAALEGKSQAIHRNYAMNRAGDVRNHIIPRLPKKLQCRDVSFNLIDSLQQDIIEEKGVNVWLNVRRTLSPAIKELIRTRVLLSDPFLGIETYSANSHSNVGSFTQTEANALLRQMYRDCTTGRDVETRKLFPGSRKKEKEYRTTRFMLDRRVWLASCVLFQCGLRLGEVIAMTIDQISLPNSDGGEDMAILIVDKAYGLKDGIKEPKGKQDRAVAVPYWLASELLAMYEQNPWKCMGNKFIFFSTEVKDKPCAESFIRKWFYNECDQIGITEDIREKRHLVVHSCRHTVTQRIKTRAGSEAALTVIGHSGEAVQNRYDNAVDLERVLNIGKKTGSIIPSIDDMANAI